MSSAAATSSTPASGSATTSRAAQWCEHVTEFSERWSDRITFAACRTHYADILIWRGVLGRGGDASSRPTSARWPRSTPAGSPTPSSGWPSCAAARAVPTGGRAAGRRGRGPSARAAGARRAGARPRRPGRRRPGGRARAAAHAPGGPHRPRRRASSCSCAPGWPRATPRARATSAGELRAIAGGPAPTRPRPLGAAGGGAGVRRGRGHGRPRGAPSRTRSTSSRGPAGASRRPRPAATWPGRCARSARTRRPRARPGRPTTRCAHWAPRAGDRAGGAAPAGLTPRELEVLRLVARAAPTSRSPPTLVLSVRTVERHVANIYDKIGASGRAGRAAAASYALAVGLR